MDWRRCCGYADLAMDIVNIKVSQFGGLTRAQQARDFCVEPGIAMTIEDTWSGDIITTVDDRAELVVAERPGEDASCMATTGFGPLA
jgi:hypothetical protein